MSHIPGHWEDNAQSLDVGAARATKTFGHLKIYNDDKILKETVPFDFLFFNNRYFKGSEGEMSAPVGCHIHLIEFEYQGTDTLFLALAADIVDFKTHQSAEQSFLKVINLETKFVSDNGLDENDIKKLKSDHGAAGASGTHDKIEKFTPELINGVAERIEKSSKAKGIHGHAKIMKQTSAYMQTPSFKTIYANGNAIDWLKDAVDKKILLTRDDLSGKI
jgi:hypothetical protein